jgi:hypothetical protein
MTEVNIIVKITYHSLSKKYLRKIASNIDMNIVHAYPIQNVNYCSHAEQLTFNCHKGGGGAYHGTVVYFVIFRCCFFPCHFGTIPSIVIFYIWACRRR